MGDCLMITEPTTGIAKPVGVIGGSGHDIINASGTAMATQTLHYHLTKPASADRVAVGDLNDNSDTIDGYLFRANERADQMADDYNASET